MLTPQSVRAYRGPAFERGPGHAYLAPAPALAPYIANYTITCPTPETMPAGYTVLPTASATLTYAVGGGHIADGLRGVNTRPCQVGAYAGQHTLLLLIEFHAAGLYPLLRIPQSELLDISLSFSQVHAPLHRQILQAMEASNDIPSLCRALDAIFLAALADAQSDAAFSQAMAHVLSTHSQTDPRALSALAHYSQRHLARLFHRHVGTGIKTFLRIVRVNHAMRLLSAPQGNMAAVAAASGYFDQPHFIHEFQSLCDMTPQAYLRGMSIFYNDTYKL